MSMTPEARPGAHLEAAVEGGPARPIPELPSATRMATLRLGTGCHPSNAGQFRFGVAARLIHW